MIYFDIFWRHRDTNVKVNQLPWYYNEEEKKASLIKSLINESILNYMHYLNYVEVF